MTKIVYALKVFLGFFQKSYPKREFFNVTFLEILKLFKYLHIKEFT